jgi:hypothetical protein
MTFPNASLTLDRTCRIKQGRPRYRCVASPGELFHALRQIGAGAATVDVEPMVSSWRSTEMVSSERLDRVARFLFAAGIHDLVFATNSGRVPDRPVGSTWRYIAHARKPWGPGLPQAESRSVVVGDQFVTDGLFAARRGAIFIHIHQPGPRPMWVWVQTLFGALLRVCCFSTHRVTVGGRER